MTITPKTDVLQLMDEKFLESQKDRSLVDMKETIKLIKAAISNWQTDKKNIGKPVTTRVVFKILIAEYKKRRESIAEFSKNDSAAAKLNIVKEQKQIMEIKRFLPVWFKEDELTEKVTELAKQLASEQITGKKAMGKIFGEFNEHYVGEFDPEMLQPVVNKVLGLAA